MVKNLRGLSKKFFLSNKVITFSSIIAIALSILLIISLMNFSINSENNLKRETSEKFGNFQMQCGYEMESTQRVTEEFFEKVSSLEGIEKISPVIVDSINININGINTYTVGVENDDLSRSKYKYNSTINENEVVINKQLSDTLKVSKGDILWVNGNEKRIVEVFNDKTYSSNSINMAILNRNDLIKLVNFKEYADYIMIKVESDDDISTVSQKLIDLDTNLRVEVFQEDENLKENVNTMKYFISFLGILVFIMCGIFIIANLQRYIYKYTKDFAIIKSIGGSSLQVFKTVLMQTMLMNISGILSGIFLSFLINRLFLHSFKYYIGQSLKISLTGFIIIQIILFIPAFKTARVLPIKAMSKNENVEFKHLKLIRFFIMGSFGVGSLLILDSILLNEKDSFTNGIVGFLFIYLGCFWLLIRYINNILSIISRFMKIIIGCIGEISIKMLAYQVKKSSTLILAIITMIIITVIGGSFVKLITNTNEKYYRSEYISDIVLTNDTKLNYNDTVKILEDINKIDNTSAFTLTQVGTTCARYNNTSENVTFVLGNFDEMEKNNFISKFEGDRLNKVIVNENYAKINNISVGDKIKVITPNYGNSNTSSKKEGIDNTYQYTLEVSSIENEKMTNNADLLIDIGNSAMIEANSNVFNKIYIYTTDPNINVLLNNIKSEYPSIKWSDMDTVLNNTNSAIKQKWKYFELSLIIINFIILLGIVVSIKSDINSNRKEYALLRCMKLKKNDLRKMIVTQVIVFLLFGQLVGAILGTIGSFVISLSDGGNLLIFPDYKLLLIICMGYILITIICIIPDITRIEKEKLILELNKEQL
ncbi:MAG: FtsX-like permease family protein [Clostridium butyricum]|nr:FtsX-like permease family protein [Clostridium butyricum]MDU5821661.1 FtsX-like permease family protein [Clostridium butyricum]